MAKTMEQVTVWIPEVDLVETPRGLVGAVDWCDGEAARIRKARPAGVIRDAEAGAVAVFANLPKRLVRYANGMVIER